MASLNDFAQKKALILDRIEILDVVSEHVTLKRRGSRFVGLCPFHTEKTPSFTVSPDRGLFKCFGCDKGGDVFTFVQEQEHVDFMEAMRLLADRAGVDLEPTGPSSTGGVDRSQVARANQWALTYFRRALQHEEIGRETRKYLAQRGITEETAELFGLGLAVGTGQTLTRAATSAGLTRALLLEADLIRESERGGDYDTFRNRLMFPIRDVTRRVVGFGGRTLGDDAAKYLNTRQNVLFDKGKGLYGIDLARAATAKTKRAILVEGYTDCIACHQAGFTETVATLGTALTESQVDLLRRYCEEVILLFDSDRAGEAAADRAIGVALPRHLTVRLARIPDGKDPSEFLCSYNNERFSDVLNDGVDALEFKWSQLKDRFQSGTSDGGRREAILDFIGLIAEASESGAMDAIQRGLVANRVAGLLGIEPAEVHRLMAKGTRRRPRTVASGVGDQAEVDRNGPIDAEQAAWANFLEVLVNEPALLTNMEKLPEIGRIANQRDHGIAREVVSLHGEIGEFKLSDLLARFADPSDTRRISELAERGRARGNYEATLRVALQRIDRAARSRALGEARQHLADSGEASEDTESLARIHQSLKEHRHYVPSRMLRRSGEESFRRSSDEPRAGEPLEHS